MAGVKTHNKFLTRVVAHFYAARADTKRTKPAIRPDFMHTGSLFNRSPLSAVRLIPIIAALSLISCGSGSNAEDLSNNPTLDSPESPASNNDSQNSISVAADAGSDVDTSSGSWLTLDGSNSTGNKINYSWRQVGGPGVDIQGEDSAKPGFNTPTVSYDQILTFELVVTDADGATSKDNVDVVVHVHKSVYLIVDPETQVALSAQIDQLRKDVETSLGAVGRVFTTPSTPLELRALLRTGYETDGLRGAFLIGNVPGVYFQSLVDSSIVQLNDSFYRALYCAVQSTADPTRFLFAPTNSVNYSCLPNIWVSRIKSPNSAESTADISSYLSRNHATRSVYDNWNQQMDFVSAMAIDDKANYSEIVADVFADHPLYTPAAVSVFQSPLASNQKQDFLTGLNNNSEILKANFHGAPFYVWFQGLTTGDSLDSTQLQSVHARPRYIELESCSTGAFDSESYFAGELLFNGDSLLVTANPMVTGYFSGAFEDQVESVYRGYALGWSPAQLYVYTFIGEPKHFLGDPTVALRPHNESTSRPQLRIGSNEYAEPFSIRLNMPASAPGETTEAELEVTNPGNQPLILTARSDVAEANTVLPDAPILSTTGFVFTMTTADDPINFHLQIALQPGETKAITVHFNPQADDLPRPANSEYAGLFRFTTNAPDTPAFNVAVFGSRQ